MTRWISKRLRLRDYDYATAGAYFVTICAYQRQLLFEDQSLRSLIEATWIALPERFANVRLDAWVVMPNHFHAIIWITELPQPIQEQPTLSVVIGGFKSIVAVQWLEWLREYAPNRSAKIWQRGYYDRIIRDARHLQAVRRYIHDNPERWRATHNNGL